MIYEVIKGLSLPFIGTLIGVLCVLFVKNNLSEAVQGSLCGFAAGVMTAASVWSLLLPSLEYTEDLGALCFAPAAVGFMVGIFFVMILDKITESVLFARAGEAGNDKKRRGVMLSVAVCVHNIPEGMAVGIVYAELLAGGLGVSAASALALAFGIALQNIPEGAIISVPLKAQGESSLKALAIGVISAAVELLGALVTVAVAGKLLIIMPYALAFAAGAMMYVVASELLPEAKRQGQSSVGVFAFAVGFCVMMALDTVFS